MADRKPLRRYYPADFDPSRIARSRSPKAPQKHVVNFACPFRSMKCTSCGHYMIKGMIVRLHCKCKSCGGEIIFETDPKNMDYRLVRGAKREYGTWRDEERVGDTEEQWLDRLECEDAERNDVQEQNTTAMENLERKTQDAKAAMAVPDALDAIRAVNARREKVEGNTVVHTLTAAKDVEDAADAEIA
ncbi:hypothetical protein EJ02DRAFT_439899 [Clathrospora elynae]|uniref:Uncharacterized protein n=1 Tax=Clathrospora elynae TaxID=706981 RepID=A0A6A5T509_9PLEO|nr:hypothetical protein EJ02DRAFT_439899 [Clathrospora elynae]